MRNSKRTAISYVSIGKCVENIQHNDSNSNSNTSLAHRWSDYTDSCLAYTHYRAATNCQNLSLNVMVKKVP